MHELALSRTVSQRPLVARTRPWNFSMEPTETPFRPAGLDNSRIALTQAWALYGAITPISPASTTGVKESMGYL
jgi:hypothetical protein